MYVFLIGIQKDNPLLEPLLIINPLLYLANFIIHFLIFGGFKTNLYSHSIHVLYLYLCIYCKDQLIVGRFTTPMDPMGIYICYKSINFTGSLSPKAL